MVASISSQNEGVCHQVLQIAVHIACGTDRPHFGATTCEVFLTPLETYSVPLLRYNAIHKAPPGAFGNVTKMKKQKIDSQTCFADLPLQHRKIVLKC